jgi:hypothetical protein
MYFELIWYIFAVLVSMLYQEKSGNPDANMQRKLSLVVLGRHVCTPEPEHVIVSSAGFQ